MFLFLFSCENGYPPKFIQNIQAKKPRSSTTNVSPEELNVGFVGMSLKHVNDMAATIVDKNIPSTRELASHRRS